MISYGVLVVVLLEAGAFGQCPPSNPPSPPSTPCPTDNLTCPNVTNIDRPLSDLYYVQPVAIKFLPATEENKKLDHICNTFFPSPKDNNTFIVYEVRTYTDCSYEYENYIGGNINTGANSYANPRITYVSNIIGGTNCSTFVKYRCNTYGDNVDPYVFGQGPLSGGCSGGVGCGFTADCMQEALELIRSSGLPAYYSNQEYYTLPCKCPINCAYQQPCVDVGNPIYDKQGGGCLPKDSSAC